MTSREAEIQARLDEWPSTPQEYIMSCPEDWSDVGYDYVASRAFDQGYGYGLYKARPDVAYLLARVAMLESQVAAVRELIDGAPMVPQAMVARAIAIKSAATS